MGLKTWLFEPENHLPKPFFCDFCWGGGAGCPLSPVAVECSVSRVQRPLSARLVQRCLPRIFSSLKTPPTSNACLTSVRVDGSIQVQTVWLKWSKPRTPEVRNSTRRCFQAVIRVLQRVKRPQPRFQKAYFRSLGIGLKVRRNPTGIHGAKTGSSSGMPVWFPLVAHGAQPKTLS